MFANTTKSDSSCEFGIPDKIKNIKQLSIIDDFYEIENYRCLYGFSKSQYDQNADNLKDIDLHKFIEDKASVKYYLIIDARQISKNKFISIIEEINSLNIKPKHLSLLISPSDPDEKYDYIRNNLSCNKWTIHVFIDSLSFNDCINTILDTSLTKSESWCLLFLDASQLDKKINSLISSIQDTFIIKQKSFFGIKKLDNSLHMLCLNCMVYKTLVSTIDRDILKSISSTPEIFLETYEIQ
jgi:hypothetical protein